MLNTKKKSFKQLQNKKNNLKLKKGITGIKQK